MDLFDDAAKLAKARIRAVETRHASRDKRVRQILTDENAFLRVTRDGYNTHQRDPDNLLPTKFGR